MNQLSPAEARRNKERGRAIRQNGYERNMRFMRLWKETHPCSVCGQKFAHQLIQFETPSKGEWTISRLAGSRCTVEALEAAMKKTRLICLVCRDEIASLKAERVPNL